MASLLERGLLTELITCTTNLCDAHRGFRAGSGPEICFSDSARGNARTLPSLAGRRSRLGSDPSSRFPSQRRHSQRCDPPENISKHKATGWQSVGSTPRSADWSPNGTWTARPPTRGNGTCSSKGFLSNQVGATDRLLNFLWPESSVFHGICFRVQRE